MLPGGVASLLWLTKRLLLLTDMVNVSVPRGATQGEVNLVHGRPSPKRKTMREPTTRKHASASTAMTRSRSSGA